MKKLTKGQRLTQAFAEKEIIDKNISDFLRSRSACLFTYNKLNEEDMAQFFRLRNISDEHVFFICSIINNS